MSEQQAREIEACREGIRLMRRSLDDIHSRPHEYSYEWRLLLSEGPLDEIRRLRSRLRALGVRDE